MNYAELKARVATDMHRKDLTARIPEWIDNARQRINARFGIDMPAFVADTDTNDILTQLPMLYVYASLAEGCTYTRDQAGIDIYEGKFGQAIGDAIMNSRLAAVDPYTDADGNPPVIMSDGGV